MPTFVHLLTLAEVGVSNIGGGIQPNPAATAGRFDGELLSDYPKLGRYDVVIVSAFPSEVKAAQYSLAISEEGFVRCETLRAFEMEDYVDIIQGLG